MADLTMRKVTTARTKYPFTSWRPWQRKGLKTTRAYTFNAFHGKRNLHCIHKCRAVTIHMLSAIMNLKIFNFIIGFVAVFVVYNFFRCKTATQVLCHYVTMLRDIIGCAFSVGHFNKWIIQMNQNIRVPISFRNMATTLPAIRVIPKSPSVVFAGFATFSHELIVEQLKVNVYII